MEIYFLFVLCKNVHYFALYKTRAAQRGGTRKVGNDHTVTPLYRPFWTFGDFCLQGWTEDKNCLVKYGSRVYRRGQQWNLRGPRAVDSNCEIRAMFPTYVWNRTYTAKVRFPEVWNFLFFKWGRPVQIERRTPVRFFWNILFLSNSDTLSSVHVCGYNPVTFYIIFVICGNLFFVCFM